ncbi:MAG: phosphohistidine phosphatase SixA [Candidatus Bathyarchaeota archaeon]|nr:phosphohistidine phosphatase SixA [Candidatus Bathyarchaeota archaeon]
MRLYLIQHAEAKRKDADPARPLSGEGWETARRMARHIEGLKIDVDQIVHSGKLRAEQTAKTIAGHLNPPNGVLKDESLEPLAVAESWKERLNGTQKNIMLVGHLPHLSKLASSLLVGNQEAELIAFRMGGVVCLERNQENRWSIQWIITPEAII